MVVKHVMLQRSTAQHSTAQHSTAQHSTPQHTTPHHTTPHLTTKIGAAIQSMSTSMFVFNTAVCSVALAFAL
jgi:hypothetical protein